MKNLLVILAVLLLSGCASLEDKIEECESTGGRAQVVESYAFQAECDCDVRTTFEGVCSRNVSKIRMGTDSNGHQLYCGALTVKTVHCEAPPPVGLFEIITQED